MAMSVIDNGDAYIGTWSPEVVQELTTILRPMMSQQGGTMAGISWVDIAAHRTLPMLAFTVLWLPQIRDDHLSPLFSFSVRQVVVSL